VATTAVFAEILIVGLEAAAWLALLILGVLGRSGVDVHGLKGWDALVTIVVVAGVYALGIVVDRISDSLGRWLESTSFGKRFDTYVDLKGDGVLPEDTREKRFAVMQSGGGMAQFLEYQRSRLRVARASFVNLALALPSGLLYFLRRPDISWGPIAVYGVAVSLLTVASYFTARRIWMAYTRGLQQAYDLRGKGG